MSHILVVGRGFIGREVAAALGAEAILADHEAVAGAANLRGFSTVVYAGRDPRLGTETWTIDSDLEPRVARLAAEVQASFVTLGTRKVYAPGLGPLREADRVTPADLYGRQKLALEHALVQVMGPRLTRLRLANIFGFERDPRRRTFLTQALAGLDRHDEIRFDVSPFVTRDFLPVESCARWIAEFARRPPGGVVNIGSGVPLAVGRIALWLIEGYGRGRLVIESPKERDSFVLDVHHLRSLLGGVSCGYEQLHARAIDIGRQLRRSLERR